MAVDTTLESAKATSPNDLSLSPSVASDPDYSGLRDWSNVMIDLLLPATDGGVLAQMIVVVVAGVVAVVATRRHTEWRLVAMGGTIVALGLLGLRALH